MTYAIRITDPARGRTFLVSPEKGAHMRLLEDGLNGFGATELFVETEPYADGSGGHPVNRRFGERHLSLTGELVGDEGELRRLLCSMLDPKETLEMEITLGEVTRCIGVIPCGKPRFHQANFYTPTEVYLPFVAPDPFFRDAVSREVHFRNTTPLFTFPLNFMAGAGMTPSLYRTTETALVVNPGDADCGLVAQLTARGGAVVNPAICLGERYIRLQTTLDDGETAQIDTRPRCKDLTIDGVRSFTFHRDSDFFLLAVGENTVQVTAETGLANLSVQLAYTPLYYGI